MNAFQIAEHIEMERDALLLLCSVLLKPTTRLELCRLLDSSKFIEPLQRVLLEEIRTLGTVDAKHLLQLLPIRVNNRGFPDFDLQDLLTPKLVSEEQIERLFESALRLMDIDNSSEESVEYPAYMAPRYRILTVVEALVFSALVATFIWRWQTAHQWSWTIFPVWLVVSILAHRDTPKTLGWRADNLWSATRQGLILFAVFVAAVCVAGLFLGAFHHLPEHLIDRRRFFGYFSFCLLQQVAVNSYLMNRFLSSVERPVASALLASAIFGALHWPNPVLVPVTLIGGFGMCLLFARQRNIFPLTLGQAILGGLVWWAFPVAWHHAMRVGPGYYSFARRLVVW